MVTLLETDHFDDQLAALSALQDLPCVRPDALAVAGTSFGGIQTVLMAERGRASAPPSILRVLP
jgi:dipeptidyl aminopeptidase/acylaminoacyl peptidase